MEINIHETIKNKLETYVKTQKVPHIIFHGPSGSGKRNILNFLINKLYKTQELKKKYIMWINCAHGKGIRFIRNELKFFAKTNIHNKGGKLFKSIVLFNADKLTIDAQSALRRCIEQFSHTTRFFIIVENQTKLLKPILSRFCNINIPIVSINKKFQSLHSYNKNEIINKNNKIFTKRLKWLKEKLDNKDNYNTPEKCILFCEKIYNKSYSALNIMTILEKTNTVNQKYLRLIYFDKLRKEYRTEKLLMFYLIQFGFMRKNLSLENI